MHGVFRCKSMAGKPNLGAHAHVQPAAIQRGDGTPELGNPEHAQAGAKVINQLVGAKRVNCPVYFFEPESFTLRAKNVSEVFLNLKIPYYTSGFRHLCFISKR